MDVHVDQPGDDDQAGRIDRPSGIGDDLRPDLRDPAVGDEDVEKGVDPGRGVHQTAVADEQGQRRFLETSLAGSTIRTSSAGPISFRRTLTISRREVGRTLPT